jgi:hypothetical protein
LIVIPVVIVASLATNRILLPEMNPRQRFAGVIVSEASDKILKRACFDCHSHETRWPWYAYVPPVSSLIVYDVAEGRESINFSSWDTLSADKQGKRARKMIEEVTDESMPLPRYLRLHRDALVTDADLDQLRADVKAKYGEGPVYKHEDEEEEDNRR